MENTINKQKVSINSFNTVALIGSGHYSKVALVKKKDNQKIYALKIIKKDMLAQKRQRNNLMIERNILVETKNQFIIKIEFAFQNESKFYFALEYCPGGDLYYLLQKKRRFQEEYVKFYISQIIIALEYLHSLKILYRDLKPENIMIDKDGYLKLGDFGLSKNHYEGDLIFSICGTPEYLAPEIIEQKGYDYSVDIWTVGCLIYEMAIGNPPFYVEDNRCKLLELIKNADVEIPNYLSISLQDLLVKMFKKNPKERLGYRGGMKEIRQHEWFNNFDWDRLEKRELVAPFIPQLRNEVDLQNFDPEFTESQMTPFFIDSAPQCSNFTNFDYNISQQSRVSVNNQYKRQ